MIIRETWVKTIKDFQEFELPELVERDVEVDTDPPIKRVVSVIGPRRTGKTFLMFQIMKKLLERGVEKNRILHVNFESDLLLGIELPDLRNLIEIFYEIYPENKGQKVYLFLDEIQNVPDWEKFVRTVMDSENVQVFVSGSSSKLLSKEISTSLRGRTLPYYIYPFSFKEFLKTKDFKMERYLSSSQKAKLLNLLEKYMKGSYPEVILFEREREKILREILDVTIYRDVVERFKVKNVKVLKLLLKGLASSTYFSVHKFYNYLKSLGIRVSKNTIYNYVDYFSDSLVLYTLRKYSRSYREMEQTIPKIYFVDNGLLAINGIESLSRFMENVVFLELVRKGFTPDNHNLFYFVSADKEVDFVLKKGEKIMQLIQVCYNIEDFDTKARELNALVTAGKELKCNHMFVITWDYERVEKYKNRKIEFFPLWKWLLE
jgi:predicted AAA+ superfamily ATPase